MKDWIKKLSDSDINDAFERKAMEEPVPEELDARELEKFSCYKGVHVTKERHAPFKLILAFSGVALLLFILGFTLVLVNQSKGYGHDYLHSRVIFISDEAVRSKDGRQQTLSLDDIIEKGDRIETFTHSVLDIQIGDHAIIGLEEKTEILLAKTAGKEIAIELDEGRIIAIVEHWSKDFRFEIDTHGINALVKGTQFMVERRVDGETFIYVYRGIVSVDYSLRGIRKQEDVNEGECLTITQHEARKDMFPESIRDIFRRHEWRKGKESGSSVEINLSVQPESATVTIDKSDELTIITEAHFFIGAGTHLFEFEKPDYTPSIRSLEFQPGERYNMEVLLKKKNDVIENENTRADEIPVAAIKRWMWKKIYSYRNPDNPDYNQVSGFVATESAIVAYTQTSLVCIDGEGNISWEKHYGKKSQLIFDSLPVITGNKLFISSLNKQILVLDSRTGMELERIASKGSINFNYRIVESGNRLYIPYADGIYVFDKVRNSLSSGPVVPYNSPTVPVLDGNSLFVSSFLLKEVACFDTEGKHLWTFLLDERGYAPLYKIDEYLFAGDRKGNIYMISLSGKLKKKITIPAGITSRLAGNESGLLCLGDDGTLYKLSPHELSIEVSFPIDDKADIPSYIYKFPVIRGDKVLIGSRGGEVIIINLITNRIEERLVITDSAISCAVCPLADSYVIGTEDGRIYFLEYK